MPDRRTLGVLGAVLVACATIVAVVVVAIAPTPEFPPLEAGATGLVAYEREGAGSARVLSIVELSTLATIDADVPPGSQPLGWDDAGDLEVLDAMGTRIITVDASSGQRLGTRSSDDPWAGRDPGIVWWSYDGGRLVLEREGGGSASFPAPEAYDIASATSLGEDRAVFVDELGRLALVTFGTDGQPRLIADDAAPWSLLVAHP